MTKEKKQEFTMRMTQANRTELIVVIYDLFLEYMKDAKEAHAAGDKVAFREAISHAQPVLSELISCLDFKYEISYQLQEIYRYCGRCLAAALSKEDPEELKGAVISINNLRTGFFEVSKNDKSPTLMKNSQKVYAGLTYGRDSLNESLNDNPSRGYKA